MNNEAREKKSLKQMIRNLKMAYQKAKKTDTAWDELYYAAVSLFKDLQQIERHLLGDEEEFTRNLDRMIHIYQEAKERSTASKFKGMKDKTIEDHLTKYGAVLEKLAKDY